MNSQLRTLAEPHPDALDMIPLMLGGYVMAGLLLLASYLAGGL